MQIWTFKFTWKKNHVQAQFYNILRPWMPLHYQWSVESTHYKRQFVLCRISLRWMEQSETCHNLKSWTVNLLSMCYNTANKTQDLVDCNVHFPFTWVDILSNCGCVIPKCNLIDVAWNKLYIWHERLFLQKLLVLYRQRHFGSLARS